MTGSNGAIASGSLKLSFAAADTITTSRVA